MPFDFQNFVNIFPQLAQWNFPRILCEFAYNFYHVISHRFEHDRIIVLLLAIKCTDNHSIICLDAPHLARTLRVRI